MLMQRLLAEAVSVCKEAYFIIRHLISQLDDMMMTDHMGLPALELYVFASAYIIHCISHSFKDYNLK
jgi:hypothetical protein